MQYTRGLETQFLPHAGAGGAPAGVRVRQWHAATFLFLINARSAGFELTGSSRRFKVIAPSLTPDSYTGVGVDHVAHDVVAPSLTPDSYTQLLHHPQHGQVVAPSLTPDSYTSQWLWK